MLCQVFSNLGYNAAVVLGSVENVLDLLFGPLTWKYQLERTLTIDLRNIVRVETEDGDRAGSRCFEKAWRDQPHVIERRPADHRVEPRAVHAVNHLPERNGGQKFQVQTSHVVDVGVVSLFHLHRNGPRRQRFPSVAHNADAPHPLADRSNGVEYSPHRLPPELAVASVY